MTEFTELALSALADHARPASLDQLWRLAEHEPARARASLAEIARAASAVLALHDRIFDALRLVAIARGAQATWLWSTAHDVLDRGREACDQVLADGAALDRVLAMPARFRLAALFDPWSRFEADPTVDLEDALRSCGVIRALDDVAGLQSGELVDHPEHGLGVAVIEQAVRAVSLVFPAETLRRARSATWTRHVALVREDPLQRVIWTIGVATSGVAMEVFETGDRGERFHGGLAPAIANELFERRVAAQRARGFVELGAPTSRAVAQLRAAGLAGGANSAIAADLLREVPRTLHERGLGELAGFVVRRDHTFLHVRLADRVGAPWRIWQVARALGCAVDDDLRIALVDNDELTPCLPAAASPDELALDAAPPVELGVERAHRARHFAKRSYVPIAAPPTPAATLDEIEAEVVALRDRHARGELDPAELDRRSEELGARAGEVARREVGGEWATALLFGLPAGDAVLLGEARLPWYAAREIRQRITGPSTGELVQRVRGLVERARAPRPPLRPLDHGYALAGDQGHFVAGTLPDGRLALVARDRTFGLLFDAEGRLLEYAAPARTPDLVPNTIRIRRFAIAGVELAIEDLPWNLAEVLEDPDSEPDPVERERVVNRARSWLASGQFVLYWGNDLHLDASGEVTSS